MSQIEMALALSLMIREFEFEFAGEGPPEIKLSVVLSPNHGLPMRIRRRAKARFTGVELGGEPAHAS
jgi:cytochrome P450